MSQGNEQGHPYAIVVAVGNPERERLLLGALADGGLTVAGRCLDGPSLVEQARATGVGAAIASTDLHRLTRDALLAVQEARVPLLLLVAPDEVRKFEGLAYLLPIGSDGPEVVAAVQEAVRRGVVSGHAPREAPPGDGPMAEGRGDGCEVIALVSGKGAPGTTTVAIGLAGAIAETGKRVLLVDGDLRGGSVGPYLDLDPRRGLVGLTVGNSGEPPDLVSELQDGPSFSVLAGIERPEMREQLAAEHIPTAVRAAGRGFDAVVIDAGETIAGRASPAANAFLGLAGRVLVVTTADLIGLWNARSCLRYLAASPGIPSEAVSVVINRRVGREHHGALEVERALGVPVLAMIPEDSRAARKARQEQQPFAVGGGGAARHLRALAMRVTESASTAAEEAPADDRARWRWRRQPAEGRR